ncbi:ImmA/IrrE family metallo-endopeptidase [Cytobacillus horneckiae]|uniref:ImmA/IrrE family metallo-endopeptidase n=1 Tax=Cytobacillus horneckiae TaxID=549687 RepID=UPI000A05CFDF|nr:ImmA/IrrE family metallo-endopeptidase [Cytobacillus horneckiae]
MREVIKLSWIIPEAEKLIVTYKTNNPFELASYLNIHVYEWEFPSEIKCVYKYYKRNKFIYLNSNLDEKKKAFVCGHKIGHSFIHPKVNTFFLKSKTWYSKDRLEREAHLFSLSLLLHNYKLTDFYNLEHLCRHFGIPTELSYLVKKFY